MRAEEISHRLRKRCPHFFRAALEALDSEGMVSAFDPVQRCRVSDSRDHGLKQGSGRERVSCSLEEEHRQREAVEVLVPDLLGLSRRMQGVADVNQPGGRHSFGYRH